MLPSRWEMNIVAAAKELERMQRVVNEARSELHQIRFNSRGTHQLGELTQANVDRSLAFVRQGGSFGASDPRANSGRDGPD